MTYHIQTIRFLVWSFVQISLSVPEHSIKSSKMISKTKLMFIAQKCSLNFIRNWAFFLCSLTWDMPSTVDQEPTRILERKDINQTTRLEDFLKIYLNFYSSFSMLSLLWCYKKFFLYGVIWNNFFFDKTQTFWF